MRHGFGAWCGLIAAVCVWVCVQPVQTRASEVPAESLVLLHRPAASPLAGRFAQTQLPKIEALAREMGVAFRAVDIDLADGAPEAVGITPLVVFQNHRGRSVYQGRTATLAVSYTHLTLPTTPYV